MSPRSVVHPLSPGLGDHSAARKLGDGLDPSKVVAVNLPVEARIDQIRINPERARWILRTVDPELASGVRFTRDVYGRDRSILAALNRRFRFGRSHRKP